MAANHKTHTIEFEDGGRIVFVPRGRYVHMEVTDKAGKTLLVRASEREARKCSTPIKLAAFAVETNKRQMDKEQGLSSPTVSSLMSR